jgi:hypothetical protein
MVRQQTAIIFITFLQVNNLIGVIVLVVGAGGVVPLQNYGCAFVTVQQHHICVVIGLLMCEKHTSQADS